MQNLRRLTMKQSYYIFTSGELKRHNNSLTLVVDDEVKKDIPIERIYDLYVFSEVTYNTKLFTFLSSQGISVHMFNYYEFYIGSFYPKEQLVSGKLLARQVQYYYDPEKRLNLAQKTIDAASYNIQRNLKYYNSRGKDLQKYIDSIDELRNKIYDTKSVTELMGIEGNIRKTYYETWNIIINTEINFEKRIKRPPDNMINSLISFLNSVMYTKTLSEIYKTQLNPTISYLHETGEKRFSLALDVSEIFKPLIVDRTIFTLLNKNIISENDFYKDINFLKMKEDTMKKVVKELDNTLSRTIHHRTLNREVSYKHLIRLELYKLINHYLETKEYDGFKIWW